MFDNYLQIRAMNIGMSYQDFILLIYLREHMYLTNMKCVDIYNTYPIFLKTSKNVQDSLEKLNSLDFIEHVWDKGQISILYNVDKFTEFFTPEKDKVIKIKRPTQVKNNASLFSDEENEIIEYYKTLQTLPKVVSMTPKRILSLQNALSEYSVDNIKEALLFASKQQWLVSKSDERWCDMSWILDKISEFMSGGKYNKEKVDTIPSFGNKTTAVYL